MAIFALSWQFTINLKICLLNYGDNQISFYIRLYQIMMMTLQEWDEIPLRVGVSRKVEMLQVVLWWKEEEEVNTD